MEIGDRGTFLRRVAPKWGNLSVGAKDFLLSLRVVYMGVKPVGPGGAGFEALASAPDGRRYLAITEEAARLGVPRETLATVLLDLGLRAATDLFEKARDRGGFKGHRPEPPFILVNLDPCLIDRAAVLRTVLRRHEGVLQRCPLEIYEGTTPEQGRKFLRVLGEFRDSKFVLDDVLRASSDLQAVLTGPAAHPHLFALKIEVEVGRTLPSLDGGDYLRVVDQIERVTGIGRIVIIEGIETARHVSQLRLLPWTQLYAQGFAVHPDPTWSGLLHPSDFGSAAYEIREESLAWT